MTHYDITGDATPDPNAYIHCVACKRVCDITLWVDEPVCACGADLAHADAIVTGRVLAEEMARADAELAEWTALNVQAMRPVEAQ